MNKIKEQLIFSYGLKEDKTIKRTYNANNFDIGCVRENILKLDISSFDTTFFIDDISILFDTFYISGEFLYLRFITDLYMLEFNNDHKKMQVFEYVKEQILSYMETYKKKIDPFVINLIRKLDDCLTKQSETSVVKNTTYYVNERDFILIIFDLDGIKFLLSFLDIKASNLIDMSIFKYIKSHRQLNSIVRFN